MPKFLWYLFGFCIILQLVEYDLNGVSTLPDVINTYV